MCEHVGRALGAARRPDSRPRPAVRRRADDVPSPKFSRVLVDAAVAHLVVQPGQRDVVALTDGAVGIDRNFGTMNSEMPFVPGRPPGILASTRCTMFSVSSWSAAGDPHLGSEEPIGAVVLRFGTAVSDVGQRRARLGSPTGHIVPENRPAQHRLDEGVDLLLGAEFGQQVGVAPSVSMR